MDISTIKDEPTTKSTNSRGPQLVGLNRRINDELLSQDRVQSLEGRSNNFLQHINLLSSGDTLGVRNGASSSTQRQIRMGFDSINTPPTSLTNLAQLSGITVLPVDRRDRQASTNSVRDDHSSTRQRSRAVRTTNKTPLVMNIPNLGQRYNSHASKSRAEGRDRELSDNSGANLPSIKDQQPVYNLTSISSIDSINQAYSAASVSNDVTGRLSTASHPKGNRSSKKSKNQDLKQTTTNRSQLERLQSRNKSDRTPLILNDNVQLIPLPNSYQCPNYTSLESGTSSFEDQLDGLFDDGADRGFNGSSLAEGMNLTNDSIMQLMAVFSNPALTITPVTGPPPPMSSNYDDSIASAGCDTGAVVLPINKVESLSQTYEVDNWLSNSQSTHELASDRMPKSAANLQRIYTGSSRETSDIVICGRSESDSFVSKPVEDSDSPLNGHSSSMEIYDSHSGLDAVRIDEDCEFNSYHGISRSIRGLLAEQQDDTEKLPTVSVQLLRQLANQSKLELEKPTNSSPEVQVSDLMTKSDTSKALVPKFQDFDVSAKVQTHDEIVYIDERSLPKSSPKLPMRTTKDRLYISTVRRTRSVNTRRIIPDNVTIERLNLRSDHYLSDKHQMIESMRPTKRLKLDFDHSSSVWKGEDSLENFKGSKIDANIHQRKRLEFELAHERDLNNGKELDFDYLGYLNFHDYDETPKALNKMEPVAIQLPAEEEITKGKRKFMEGLGLLTRYEKNKISTELCEKRMTLHSELAFEQLYPIPQDIKRFVDMVLKTGGTNIELRTETDIKRNDLPLLEGLNRNTSRLKMSYMSGLGLDKRSKRTALYKVGRSSDSSSAQASKTGHLATQGTKQNKQQHNQQQNHSNDLSNRAKPTNNNPRQNTRQLEQFDKQDTETEVVPLLFGFDHVSRAPLSTIAISCRDAMNKPSKQDYMKSLGLISS